MSARERILSPSSSTRPGGSPSSYELCVAGIPFGVCMDSLTDSERRDPQAKGHASCIRCSFALGCAYRMRRVPFEPICPATVCHARSLIGVAFRDHRALFVGSERGHKLRDIDRHRDGLISQNFLEPQQGLTDCVLLGPGDQWLREDRTPCQRVIARFREKFSSIKRRALRPHSRLKSLSSLNFRSNIANSTDSRGRTTAPQ